MKGPIDFVMPGDMEAKERLAARLGYRSLGVFDNGPPVGEGPKCLIVTDRDGNLGPTLRKERMDSDFIVVASPTKNRLMKAASDDRVDAICPDFTTVWLDDALAGMVKRKGSSLLFAFSPVLRSEGLGRIILLRRLSKALETVEEKDIPFTIASLAQSPLEMRGPKDLSNLFSVLGASEKKAKMAVNDVPIGMIKRNIERRGLIAPGVKIVKKHEQIHSI